MTRVAGLRCDAESREAISGRQSLWLIERSGARESASSWRRGRALHRAIAVAAQFSGWYYLLFPELAAQSRDDVLTRPWGKWASQPGRLIVTPVLGAAVGTLITRRFPYGVLTIVLIVFRVPASSRAAQVEYRPRDSSGCATALLGYQELAVSRLDRARPGRRWLSFCCRGNGITAGSIQGPSCFGQQIDDVLETPPTRKKWILPFFRFLTVMACLAMASGLRFILFPPLIVMAYEMFAHPTTCPWAGKPLALPVACFLTSTAGWGAVSLFGSGGIAAGCGLVFGIIALRLLRIHMPPALASDFFRSIIDSPSI